jgi:integrase
MANTLNKLTALEVRSITKPGRHSDGGGLYLVVEPSGAKRWSFMFKLNGKQREAGLGSIDKVTLRAARDIAAEGREMLGRKPPVDPLDKWRADREAAELAAKPAEPTNVPTFEQAIRGYLDAHESHWTSHRHYRVTRSMLERHAGALMKLPVDEIASKDVVAVIGPLVKAGKPKTAARLRGHIEATLSQQIALGHVSGLNVARWKDNIKTLVPGADRRSWRTEHFAAMDYADAPGFIRRLRAERIGGDDAICVPAYALEFLIFTATRSGEALGCRWGEIDRAARLWRLPEERTKTGEPREIPLSDAAMEIIDAMRAISADDDGLVFPGRFRQQLADKALGRLLKRMGEASTTHGFRSTFRDWSGCETPTPREICEMALGHKVGNAVERAYRRIDPIRKLRDLFELWAAYVSTPPSADDNVVPFPNKAQA